MLSNFNRTLIAMRRVATYYTGVLVAHLLLRPTLSLSSSSSSSSPQHQPPPRAASSLPSTECPFLSFEFDPSTGICRNPASFRYSSNSKNKGNDDEANEENNNDQFFVLRNVPGDGDCIFHAVLSSVFISMGFMNLDAMFVKSDTLVSSMALEMRRKLLVCFEYILFDYKGWLICILTSVQFALSLHLYLRCSSQISVKSRRRTLCQQQTCEKNRALSRFIVICCQNGRGVSRRILDEITPTWDEGGVVWWWTRIDSDE